MFRFVLPVNSLLMRWPRQWLVLFYMEGLWDDKPEFCTKEMVKQLARVWSSTFFNLEYEFIPLFDSWAKITSAIMTIITKKVTLHFFYPSVTVFGAEKCFAYFFTRNKTYDFAKTITYVVTQNYWERERIQIRSCLWYCSIASLTNRKYLYSSERIAVQ